MNIRALLILAALTLVGCQQVADVSALPQPYQRLAVAALAEEDVDTTTTGHGWEWTIELDPTLPAPDNGQAEWNLAGIYCRIRIRLDSLTFCSTDSLATHFKVVVQHEATHCKRASGAHDPDPSSLMNELTPCYPVD